MVFEGRCLTRFLSTHSCRPSRRRGCHRRRLPLQPRYRRQWTAPKSRRHHRAASESCSRCGGVRGRGSRFTRQCMSYCCSSCTVTSSGSGYLLFTAERLLCLKVRTTCVWLLATVLLRSALNVAAEKQDAAAERNALLHSAMCTLSSSRQPQLLQCTGHGSVQ